jgi:hypothetical protein
MEVLMIRAAIGRTGRVSAVAFALALALGSAAFAQNATTNSTINPDGSTTTTTTTPPPGTSSTTSTTVVPNYDGSTTTYSTTKTQDYMGNTTTKSTTTTTKP